MWNHLANILDSLSFDASFFPSNTIRTISSYTGTERFNKSDGNLNSICSPLALNRTLNPAIFVRFVFFCAACKNEIGFLFKVHISTVLTFPMPNFHITSHAAASSFPRPSSQIFHTSLLSLFFVTFRSSLFRGKLERKVIRKITSQGGRSIFRKSGEWHNTQVYTAREKILLNRRVCTAYTLDRISELILPHYLSAVLSGWCYLWTTWHKKDSIYSDEGCKNLPTTQFHCRWQA